MIDQYHTNEERIKKIRCLFEAVRSIETEGMGRAYIASQIADLARFTDEVEPSLNAIEQEILDSETA